MKPIEEIQANTGLISETRLFTKVKEGTYFINCPCIFSKNQIVQTGRTYLYAELPGTKEFALAYVLLQDAVFIDGFVMLHLVDVLTKYEWWLNQSVEPDEENCEWMLLDPIYFVDKMNKGKANKNEDTLLDFDF